MLLDKELWSVLARRRGKAREQMHTRRAEVPTASAPQAPTAPEKAAPSLARNGAGDK